MTRSDDDDSLVSYRTLRRVVGFLGIGLPFVLAAWGYALCTCGELRPSISDYYALRTRDALVGTLVTIAWFLYTYRGYDRRDDWAGNVAGFCALGVAFFPSVAGGWQEVVHFTSALGLFLALAYFSLILFTKTGGHSTPEKRIRNRIYRACGWIMLACIALMGVYYLFLRGTAATALKPVFWLESFALWAFGISWFIKGETLWRDPVPARS
jgi:hypothetical protein